jgi:hypothetical protein
MRYTLYLKLKLIIYILKITGIPPVCEKGRKHGLVEVASQADFADRGGHSKNCDPGNGKDDATQYSLT